MSRYVMDCRDTPSVANCSLVIAGEEEEVVRAGTIHAVDVHEAKDTPEFRQELRASLKPEDESRAFGGTQSQQQPLHA